MRRLGLALTVALVAACTDTPVQPPPDVSDGAPIRSISPSEVPDAVPRPDPILAVGNKSPYTVMGVTYEIMDDYRNYRERGIGSWYGTKFHGRKTSNGEIFDLYQATAAHKTLPIPSYVRVTNLANGKAITVRVNDRGPFHPDRIIDLSYGAAVKLGYMEQGTARVRVEALAVAGVDDRRRTAPGQYRFLQVGAFSSESAAQDLGRRVRGVVSAPVFLSPVAADGVTLHRVRIGPLDSAGALAEAQDALRSAGLGQGQPLP